MTTIRQIIIDAFREPGIIAAGDEPDADQLDEGLRRLDRMFKSFFGNELGEPLTDVNYGQNSLPTVFAKAEDYSQYIDTVYVPSNLRLILNIGSPATLYLPPNPRDGARFAVIDNGGNLASNNVTINGNGRKIELATTVVLSTNSINRSWFYRADLGNWVRVIDLDVDDESPLPEEFDDMLITFLTLRLGPRHGAETSNEMTEVLKRIRKLFRARYRQLHQEPSEMGLYRLTSNRCHKDDLSFPVSG